jgi:AAA domain
MPPQVTLLRELRPRPQLERLEISSVDGFQGNSYVHNDIETSSWIVVNFFSIKSASSGRTDTLALCAGREKEAIIISMVRSNDSGTVGFLSDSRYERLSAPTSSPVCFKFAEALHKQICHDVAGG